MKIAAQKEERCKTLAKIEFDTAENKPCKVRATRSRAREAPPRARPAPARAPRGRARGRPASPPRGSPRAGPGLEESCIDRQRWRCKFKKTKNVRPLDHTLEDSFSVESQPIFECKFVNTHFTTFTHFCTALVASGDAEHGEGILRGCERNDGPPRHPHCPVRRN